MLSPSLKPSLVPDIIPHSASESEEKLAGKEFGWSSVVDDDEFIPGQKQDNK